MMFSVEQKRQIAEKVENILLDIKHPEMPEEKPKFFLRIEGNSLMSWAEIRPNWMFSKENSPSVNPYNERVAEQMKKNERSLNDE